MSRGTRVVAVAAWLAGVAVLVMLVAVGLHFGGDLYLHWAAAHRLVHGQRVYVPRHDMPFDYPPSTLTLIWPMGFLPYQPVLAAWLLLSAAGMATIACLVARGLTRAVVFLALTLSAPVAVALGNGTLDSVLAVVIVGSLLAMSRGRWLLAAGLLAPVLAVKPNMAALLLLLAFARQWKPLAVAVGVPAVLNVAGFAWAGAGFRSVAVGAWANGVPEVGISLHGAGRLLGVPIPLSLRAALAVALVALAWVRWQQAETVADTSGVLILATVLCATFAWPTYLLPLTFAFTQRRSPFGWAGVVLVALGGHPLLHTSPLIATLGCLVLVADYVRVTVTATQPGVGLVAPVSVAVTAGAVAPLAVASPAVDPT